MNHSASISFLAFAAALPLAATLTAQTAIPAGNGRYDADAAGGSYVLANGNARTVTSGGNEVIRIANTGTSGTYSLTINGSVVQSGTGRGARTGTGTGAVYNVTVATGGLLQAYSDDAIQGRVGVVNLTNGGTIYSGTNFASTPSTVQATGQALDFTDATGGTVLNNATGVIRADGHDAVRLGSNMTFTNHGLVYGAGLVNDSSSNNFLNTAPANTSIAETYSASEGVSFEGGSNSSLVNHGTITGARHGVEAAEAATGVTITNQSTGEIIGRNGSGVGFDTTETDASKIVVNNHGLIRGDYAGAGNIVDRTGNLSPTNDGDGDGVDIDGAATIRNYSTGRILSTGAGGYDSSGRANNSEAISIGGGIIVNDGLIQGADRAIVVNNDSVASRSGVAATTITNNATGTIEGLNGFAIRLENKLGDARDNDTIINSGTIIGRGSIPVTGQTVTIQGGGVDVNSTGTLDGVSYTGTGDSRFIRGDGSAIQMGEGNDTLTNTGTIIGYTGRAINMEGGNDTVNFNAGTITGDIDGGTGTDTLNLGESVSTTSAVKNFERINVASGTATLAGAVGGTTLNKGGAGQLVLSAANSHTGLTTVEQGVLRVTNTTGSATGSGNVIVNSGARLAGNGIIAGSVVFNGGLGAGSAIETLTVQGDVAWNGSMINTWNFDLGLGNTSDRLLVGRDFIKGTGTDFVFDFQSGATGGSYVLVQWDGVTTFTAADFSYTNLGAGFSGGFSIVGNQLVFSAVPEPSTYAALLGFGALGLGLAGRRRRAR